MTKKRLQKEKKSQTSNDGSIHKTGENLLEQISSVMDCQLRFSNEGKKIELLSGNGQRIIKINTKKFTSPDLALRAGAIQSAYLSALIEEIGIDSKTFLEISKDADPEILRTVLSYKGLKRLKIEDPELAQKISEAIPLRYENLS
jgi:hypothetical protein